MKQLRRSSTSSLSPTVNSSSKKKESGSASWVLGRVRRIKRCSSNVLIPSVDNTSLLPPLQSQTILRTSKSANFLVSPGITQTTNNGSDSNTTDGGGDDAYSSSSCSSFSLLATPKAVLQLEKFDDDLELIGCLFNRKLSLERARVLTFWYHLVLLRRRIMDPIPTQLMGAGTMHILLRRVQVFLFL